MPLVEGPSLLRLSRELVAGTSRLMQGLEESGFGERKFISASARGEVFEPADRANTLVVALTPKGAEKIDEFKAALRVHFGRWLSNELKKEKESKTRDWFVGAARNLLDTGMIGRLAQSRARQPNVEIGLGSIILTLFGIACLISSR